MPLGQYADFPACESAKRRQGLSPDAAKRYCGALEQKIRGSSQKPKGAYADPMSAQVSDQQGQEGSVQISGSALGTITKAIVNTIDAMEAGNVTENELQALQQALQVIQEVANIEEETAPDAPAQP
jgi:hypothetical protein